MIVHVVIHGLFAILGPPLGQPAPGVQILFLDPAGWNATASGMDVIPRHELRVEFLAGERQRMVLDDSQELKLPEPDWRQLLTVENEEAFVRLSDLLEEPPWVRSECTGARAERECLLDGEPLVRRRLELRSGVLRPCAIDVVNTVYFSSSDRDDLLNTRFTFAGRDVTAQDLQRRNVETRIVYGAAVFSYQSSSPQIVMDGTVHPLSPQLRETQPRLAALHPNLDFTVIHLFNDVPQADHSVMVNHGPFEGHFSIFYKLLDQDRIRGEQKIPLAISQRDYPSHQCIPAFLDN